MATPSAATTPASAPQAGKDDSRSRREQMSLASRMQYALRGCLSAALRGHPGPSLEAAQHLLRRAQQQGFDPKAVWKLSVNLYEDSRARTSDGPLPFSYEEVAPPSAAPMTPAPTPPS